jgi:hypothetical protein
MARIFLTLKTKVMEKWIVKNNYVVPNMDAYPGYHYAVRQNCRTWELYKKEAKFSWTGSCIYSGSDYLEIGCAPEQAKLTAPAFAPMIILSKEGFWKCNAESIHEAPSNFGLK